MLVDEIEAEPYMVPRHDAASRKINWEPGAA